MQPASPVRSAAAALLFNPHHAPAPVPPPPHLSGEESDEAHEGRAGRLSFAQGERPSQAAMFPLPSLLLGGLVDTGRDVLSLLFPRLFGELRAVEVEVEEGVTAVTREPIALTKTTSLTPRTSALPSCCQSSYRALFMSLLMPFLPLAAEACTVPTASKVHEQGTPLSLSPARPSLTGSIPLSAAPWPSPAVIHPELHPEVLFDCPDEGAVADWGGAHRNDGEDDGEQYFVRIYERFLAMAEGQRSLSHTKNTAPFLPQQGQPALPSSASPSFRVEVLHSVLPFCLPVVALLIRSLVVTL